MSMEMALKMWNPLKRTTHVVLAFGCFVVLVVGTGKIVAATYQLIALTTIFPQHFRTGNGAAYERMLLS